MSTADSLTPLEHLHALRDRLDASWQQAVAFIEQGCAQTAVAQLQALYPAMVQLHDDTLETKLFGLCREMQPLLEEVDFELKIVARKTTSSSILEDFEALQEALVNLRMELDSVRWQIIYNEPEDLP